MFAANLRAVGLFEEMLKPVYLHHWSIIPEFSDNYFVMTLLCASLVLLERYHVWLL